MFLFIGGIQPRTITLDHSPRLCPSCGLAQARLKRVDDYVSLFFIPVFPLRKGKPVLMCDRCGAVSSPEGPSESLPSRPRRYECARCGFHLDESFNYCPRCGNRI